MDRKDGGMLVGKWKVQTLADAYADRRKRTVEEMQEYRNGYHAGFIEALKLVDELHACNAGTHDEIGEAVFAYWYRELSRWKASSDGTPPPFTRKAGAA